MRNLITLLMLCSTGCATLMAPKEDRFAIRTDPEGAEIRVNGESLGRAPVTAYIPKSRPPEIEATLPGYETGTCNAQTSIGVGYVVADAALCVLLFPIGCISFIDATGAWNQLDRAQCTVRMTPAQPYRAPAPAP